MPRSDARPQTLARWSTFLHQELLIQLSHHVTRKLIVIREKFVVHVHVLKEVSRGPCTQKLSNYMSSSSNGCKVGKFSSRVKETRVGNIKTRNSLRLDQCDTTCCQRQIQIERHWSWCHCKEIVVFVFPRAEMFHEKSGLHLLLVLSAPNVFF